MAEPKTPCLAEGLQVPRAWIVLTKLIWPGWESGLSLKGLLYLVTRQKHPFGSLGGKRALGRGNREQGDRGWDTWCALGGLRSSGGHLGLSLSCPHFWHLQLCAQPLRLCPALTQPCHLMPGPNPSLTWPSSKPTFQSELSKPPSWSYHPWFWD